MRRHKVSFKIVDKTYVNPGDIVKVRVELSMKERERWPEVQAGVRLWAASMKVTLHAVQPKFQLTNAGRARLDPDRRRTDEQTLKEYGAARKLSPAVLDAGLSFVQADV